MDVIHKFSRMIHFVSAALIGWNVVILAWVIICIAFATIDVATIGPATATIGSPVFGTLAGLRFYSWVRHRRGRTLLFWLVGLVIITLSLTCAFLYVFTDLLMS